MKRGYAVLGGALALGIAGALVLPACRDISGFSTGGGSFAGAAADQSFVRVGIDAGTDLCLTLDTNHLQDGPGNLSTSDGLFSTVPLRPIPQIWQDPLSTFNFGEGRIKNLMYIASASTPFADGNGTDVFFVVSLMESGHVEVRMIRGAPAVAAPDAEAPAPPGGNLFAVFDLTRQSGPCAY